MFYISPPSIKKNSEWQIERKRKRERERESRRLLLSVCAAAWTINLDATTVNKYIYHIYKSMVNIGSSYWVSSFAVEVAVANLFIIPFFYLLLLTIYLIYQQLFVDDDDEKEREYIFALTTTISSSIIKKRRERERTNHIPQSNNFKLDCNKTRQVITLLLLLLLLFDSYFSWFYLKFLFFVGLHYIFDFIVKTTIDFCSVVFFCCNKKWHQHY